MAQNETSPFTPIFLYFLAKAYNARSGASLNDKGEFLPFGQRNSFLALMFAPAALTANAQSVTVG